MKRTIHNKKFIGLSTKWLSSAGVKGRVTGKRKPPLLPVLAAQQLGLNDL